jgi:transposase
MANRLKMAIIQAILHLHSLRWSRRRIADELGIDRDTVRRYLSRHLRGPNAAIPPAGSEGPNTATFPGLPAPEGETSGHAASTDLAADSNAAIPPAGSDAVDGASNAAIPPAGSDAAACGPNATRLGRRSECESHRELILAKLGQRLSAQRIWQDLVAEHGFKAAYDSVKRFVRSLGGEPAAPFRRLETGPGEEAQVDFGAGAPVVNADGKRRKTYVFRIVLSHSRKGYSEATFRQTTEDFIRCLENAFAHFGGAPKTLVIDNLKAAVAHPDWFDPELVPKLQSFCRHYGTLILPTRPYMPRHKGKVESGVKYVKNNALKGRSFASLEEQQRFLEHWEATVADTRIHGTTKRQVGKVFMEVERAALSPLPIERFPCFQEAQRVVARDGHVEVAKAYYSVPPEYLGRKVWARWDARLVRVFNHRWEQIAVHVRGEGGRFNTHGQHVHPHKISGLERGAGYLLGKANGIGPQAHAWAQAMLAGRGIEGTRSLQGLLSLGQKHPHDTLEKACETAISYGAFRLKTLRQLLARKAAPQMPLPFLDEHPIIRPLDDYAQIVARAIHRQGSRPSLGESFVRHDWTEAARASCAPKETDPDHPVTDGQGRADVLPPRSGDPLPGCSSAAPDSIPPDESSVVPPFPFHQE